MKLTGVNMPGRGPVPKPADQRARRNKDPIALRVIEVQRTPQPALPPAMPGGDPWPDITREWWAMWGASPLAAEFTASDWSELRDAAALHGRAWAGDTKAFTELRLRVAAFGATPADRARLRITFAMADEAERRSDSRPPAPAEASPTRARRGALKALPGGAAG